jgi:pimeloyl-ACP methyl ester carboxylesterase
MACLSPLARGEPVELTLANQVVAKAEFHMGDPDKPAVILLHGFLQTHHFPTIHRLVEALSGEGYTVLAPTLTLGVSHRSQSIACEAIHTHAVAGGVEEINAWVKWLKNRKVKRIILGGHSLGNIYNLAYLAKYPDGQVVKFIGISIIEGQLKAGEHARAGMVKKLRKSVGMGDRRIVEDQFSFCQKFRSTPESLLSYMEWGPDKILTAVQKSPVPVTMIMGSRDDRLGKDWLDRLKKTRAKVIVIDGANHFMDGQYEFDLVDLFLSELKAR